MMKSDDPRFFDVRSIQHVLASLMACVACGWALGARPAGAATLAAGDAPPPLILEQLWNAPEGTDTSWSALRGQAVVLDFWATWCGPCVQGIPELNRLVRDCRDLPVRFMAVTDEAPDTARRFLREHPIEAWVGLDTDGSVIRDFGITSRPCVVVVDTLGRVAAVTRPFALDRAFLRAVLEGRSDRLYEPLIRMDLRRHVGVAASRSGSFTERGVRLNNAGFDQILGLLSPGSEGRLDLRTPVPVGDFDFEVVVPGLRPGAWRDALRANLESMLGLSIREEARATEVLLLGRSGHREVRLGVPAVNSIVTSSPTGFVATATSMSQLAGNLGLRLGRPVVDRTGITGNHFVQLSWERRDPEVMIRAVEDQLGLVLEPATVPLTYLVVEASAAKSD